MDIKNTGIYHLFDDYRQNILKQLKLAKYFSIVITRDCDDLPASNSLLLKISKSGKHHIYIYAQLCSLTLRDITLLFLKIG